MPKTIEPTVAHASIARFNRFAIISARESTSFASYRLCIERAPQPTDCLIVAETRLFAFRVDPDFYCQIEYPQGVATL